MTPSAYPESNTAKPTWTRMLTGDRPTGALHLGHYVGSLKMRLDLQEQIDTFVLIADLHVLTTRTDNLNEIGDNIRECVLDYLAVGIDPQKTTIYLQSLVPEVLELFWLFMPLVGVGRAQRIPTLKEQMKNLHLETATMALLSYPILQAADILMVKGDVVPVGKDQASHVELTKEIAKRFNQEFRRVFPEPDSYITPVLVGTDGKSKASKSIGNVIMLSDPPYIVEQKVRRMYTDPNRIHTNMPGKVKGNPVFTYHDIFNDNLAEVRDLKRRYRKGTVGDVEVKTQLAAALNRFLDPIRNRRAEFAKQKGLVEEILAFGSARARAECRQTLTEAYDAMGLNYVRSISIPTKDELDALAAAIEQLPEDQQQFIFLRFERNLSIGETGNQMQISVDQARLLEKRAIRALRKVLKGSPVQSIETYLRAMRSGAAADVK